jgi:hypothetical protein
MDAVLNNEMRRQKASDAKKRWQSPLIVEDKKPAGPDEVAKRYRDSTRSEKRIRAVVQKNAICSECRSNDGERESENECRISSKRSYELGN